MAKSPLEMMSVLNYTWGGWRIGLKPPSSQGRTGLCFQSWGLSFPLHIPMLSLLLPSVDVVEGSLQEPGTWTSSLPAFPWIIHPSLPHIARVTSRQMLRHDCRKELSFSPTPWSQFREWSDPSGDKCWELYLWCADSALSALAFGGRQGKGN